MDHINSHPEMKAKVIGLIFYNYFRHTNAKNQNALCVTVVGRMSNKCCVNTRPISSVLGSPKYSVETT